MPGFNIGGLSGGSGTVYSGAPSNTTEFRRKYRWRFTTLGYGNTTFSSSQLLLLYKATRPKFAFKPAKINFMQEVTSLAGKHEYEAMKMTWYDAEQSPDISATVYSWLETVLDFRSMNMGHPANYKKQAGLSMTDGFGNTSESWTIYGTWPLDVDWGDLDFASEDVASIEATMQFDRAIRSCLNSNSRGNATTPFCAAGGAAVGNINVPTNVN